MKQGPSKMLIVPQLVDTFPVFCGTWKFITAFPSPRHFSIYRTRTIQSTPSEQFYLRSIFNTILPFTPCSSKYPLLFRFPHQNSACPSPIPHTCHISCRSYPSWLITRTIFEQYKSWSSSSCNLLQFPVTSSLSGPDIFRSTLFSINLSLCSSINVRY